MPAMAALHSQSLTTATIRQKIFPLPHLLTAAMVHAGGCGLEWQPVYLALEETRNPFLSPYSLGDKVFTHETIDLDRGNKDPTADTNHPDLP